MRNDRYKLYSSGEFYDLAADPLEQNNLGGELPVETQADHQQLVQRLAKFPEDAEWPWAFRSISARKFRIAADAERRASWVRENHQPPKSIAPYFMVPAFDGNERTFHAPLRFADGRPVKTLDDWQRRRQEILDYWHGVMGKWPELIKQPRFESVKVSRREAITQRQLRIEIGIGGEMVDAFMLIPDGDGPFPAVVVPFYDAQSGVGLGAKHCDFGWQLAKRGFVALSIGKPNSGVNFDDYRQAGQRGQYFGSEGKPVNVQPLSALAYAAANAHTFLTTRPEVYPDRIGIVGHSFGGKWAMFASCLYDKYACAVWSDPGIVFDERDRRKENPGGSVNYWDEWYLGFELGTIADANKEHRFRKLPSEGEPRTGAYKTLLEDGHHLMELHALMAPRPFLVSGGTADLPERWMPLQHSIDVNKLLGYDFRVAMTNRQTHVPTTASNEQIYQFFQWWLAEKAN